MDLSNWEYYYNNLFESNKYHYTIQKNNLRIVLTNLPFYNYDITISDNNFQIHGCWIRYKNSYYYDY